MIERASTGGSASRNAVWRIVPLTQSWGEYRRADGRDGLIGEWLIGEWLIGGSGTTPAQHVERPAPGGSRPSQIRE